jgi:hypothetical protein
MKARGSKNSHEFIAVRYKNNYHGLVLNASVTEMGKIRSKNLFQQSDMEMEF